MIKYHYLLESLTEEPLELVKGLQVTEQNYEIAIQWLKDRFENADKLKQVLIHKLNNLPSPRHMLVELKQFVTLAKQLCTQINSVSVIASAEDHVKSTLTQRLPKSTYEQIVNCYSKLDFSLVELFKGIEFAINLFEYQQVFEGEPVTVRSASHKPHASGNKSSANKRKDSRNSSNPKNCQLCQGDHKPAECTKYKSRDSRRERVLKLNLCFNCLSAKHKSKFCKSKYSCRKCHNRHHTAHCSDLVESGQRQSTHSVANSQHSNGSVAINSQIQGAISSEFSLNSLDFPKQTSVNASSGTRPKATTSVSTSVHCTFSNPETVSSAMPTATLKLSHQNTQTYTRALVDSGSQRSFICAKLANNSNYL